MSGDSETVAGALGQALLELGQELGALDDGDAERLDAARNLSRRPRTAHIG